MTHHDFRFEDHADLGAIVCGHVHADGESILRVSHDSDGDWQFLCDRDHDGDDVEAAVVLCVEDIVRLDPSVRELETLCCAESASRAAPGDPWVRRDDSLDLVGEHIASHGWHVMMVARGDGEDQPSMAYSIGIQESYGHPEILAYGLRPKVMHSMINICGRTIRDGRRFQDGDTWDGVLDGFTCAFRTVSAEHLGELGYARLHYGDGKYTALQLVWPDMEGKLPWQGVSEAILRQQPLRFAWTADAPRDPEPPPRPGFFGRLFGRGKS